MRLFNPFFYEKVHLLAMLAITLFYFALIYRKNALYLLKNKRERFLMFIYAMAFVLVIGLRPVSPAFGDMVTYSRTFDNFSQLAEKVTASKDALFYVFMWACSQVMQKEWFFLIVEIGYIIPIVLTCRKLFKKNADLGILFCFSAFSFFSYGVNGLRNGLSLSFVMLALTYIRGDALNKVICAVLSIVAFATHASAALPIVCMIAAYLIKDRKVMFYFWVLSILVSLLFGDAVANIFAGMGFDDRLSDYVHPDVEEDLYTVTGFRWDFILYSFAPILLGYYCLFKKKVYDSTYLLLLGTYMFANAFWIMVIRAEFSNRFAYLSWFLYPIVLAYPLLKLRIWPKTQGSKTAMIMAAHLAFTMLMVFLF